MLTTPLIFFFLVVSLRTPFVRSDCEALECVKISPSEFIGSVRTVSDVLQNVTNILKNSKFTNVNNGLEDALLQSAIVACLELIDLSTKELNWSISAIENPRGTHNNTENMSSDLKTWLSAILANTDTCMEGFEGTNGRIVKGLISNAIDQVNSLVQKLLTQVHHVSEQFASKGQFPSWFKAEDQMLLETNKVLGDVIVAIDGTGNYTKIMDAVKAAPNNNMKRFVIYIKKGVYNEYVNIDSNKLNLVMIGEGMDATIITGNRSYANKFVTTKSATFGVSGKGFIARDISFKNSAGPKGYQAVALLSDSDTSVFYRCGIFGYQDSLYARTMRQFYRECKISGTVDFIFGQAAVVFQKCQILAKKGLPKQQNTIAAQGATTPTQLSAFSFQFCNISADYDLLPLVRTTSTYLGRPWKAYSRTVFMQSYISDIVRPEGWLEWEGSKYLDTLYYAEYKNNGPGARLDKRVKWRGYHVINDSIQASNFTVAKLINGNLWLPSTNVTFTPGLGN
ncbi:hypothetical protein VNO77_22754 [Canavalia gladiata]|uniref:Pectinesterase n=1 Tax=Canavalia gladiata TaxID=3824 RepID=A0AAN9Q8A2_CANGL